MKWFWGLFILVASSTFGQSTLMGGVGIQNHAYTNAIKPVYQDCEGCLQLLVDWELEDRKVGAFTSSINYFHSFELTTRFSLSIGLDLIYTRLNYSKHIVMTNFFSSLSEYYFDEVNVKRHDIDFSIPIHVGTTINKSQFFIGPSVGIHLYENYNDFANNYYLTVDDNVQNFLPTHESQFDYRLWFDLAYNYKIYNQFNLGFEFKISLIDDRHTALCKFGYAFPSKKSINN